MPSPPTRSTVYYNSACPVCDAGIRAQRDRLAVCEVRWIDVHCDPEAVLALETPLEQVRERLHLVDADGRRLVGMPAFARLWTQSPGLRWLGRLLQLPGVRGAVGLAYNLFARALYRWNRRRGHW